jgi:alpha-mannosidase
MRNAKAWFLMVGGAVLIALSSVTAYNITTDKCNYIVAGAHMDTQYNWTRDETYNTLIPNLLHANFTLLRNNPRYFLNYSGAFRYWKVEQSATQLYGSYQRGDWDTLKSFVQRGRWVPTCGWIDEVDPNMPNPEGLIRNGLYGQGYYEDKFGAAYQSFSSFLPDDFGYGFVLPTVAVHCGMRGWSSHKFQNWGGWWAPVPANESIMKWYGPDGNFIYAATVYQDHLVDPYVDTTKGYALYNQCGLYTMFGYSGTGDNGGANSDARVKSVTNLPNGQMQGVYSFWCSVDSIFRTLVGLEQSNPTFINRMASFTGEMIMSTHGTGCYTIHGDVKSRYRQCEINSFTAEPAAVMATKVAGAAYPSSKIWLAYWKFLDHGMHDDLTGTAIDAAFYNSTDCTIKDLDTQAMVFNQVRDTANLAMGALLNTQVASGAVPVVVYNPAAIDRRDPVQVGVTFTSSPAAVQVINPLGQEVPSQIVGRNGNTVQVLFIADVPSIGYTVYEVRSAAQATTFTTGVGAPDVNTLQNNYYTMTIDGTGDVSQINDKVLGRNLCSQANRWEMRNDPTTGYPQWEMSYAAVSAAPREVVDQTVVKTVLENGPVRASIQVTRSKAGSNFTHVYQLYADSAGRRAVVDNTVAWNTNNTILKAGFYLTPSNANATFGLGLGTIDRPNMTNRRYEVPAQQWASITNSDNAYGVAIMNTYKYGWSKMANNSLHLTFMHCPGTINKDAYTHNFKYAYYSYSGDWRNGVENQNLRFNMPLVGFATTAHAGALGKTYSFFRVDDPTKIQVMAIKKAEKSTNYVIRIRELTGSATASNVRLLFGYNVASASEVNGLEKNVAAATVSGNQVSFSVRAYQVRTFSVALGTVPVVNQDRRIPTYDDRIFSVTAGRNAAKFLLGSNERVHRVAITDLKGRTVRILHNGASVLAPTAHLTWNGCDNAGNKVRSGMYFVSLVTDRSQRHAALQIVR